MTQSKDPNVVASSTPLLRIKPNILPPDHTREDYDFERSNGTGPIRLLGHRGKWTSIPPSVWCKRHGWEDELLAPGDPGEYHD